MSLEVYLLSISLARHRTIVPRPRRMGVRFPESEMQVTGQRRPGTVEAQTESPASAGPLQRIERG
jgi:hypothetical protein